MNIFNRIIKIGLIIVFVSVIIIFASNAYSQENQVNSNFNNLQKKLTNYGFIVKKEIPPYQNRYGIKPYGLLEVKNKTIWINPVVFELGNAQATLIHEATHAAQLCAGKENLVLLNLNLKPPKITHPYFMRYHNYRKEIEAQAYTIQVQKNSLELVNTLLDTYCVLR